MRQAGVIVGLAAVLALAVPAGAFAATVEVRETFGQDAVTYVAEAGEQNEVAMTVDQDGGVWRVRVLDLGPMDLGEGCEATALGALCTTSERPRVDIDLGDGADDFDGAEMADPETGKPADPIVVDGGEGGDKIVGISAYSCLDGEEGGDEIRLIDYVGSIAGHGSCVNMGGRGDDEIIGSDRADFIWAGPGRDTVEGKAAADEIDGASGLDTLRGGHGGDELLPGAGSDLVQGDSGDDLIVVEYPPPASMDGTDQLSGGPGIDSALYLCGGCRIRLDGEFNDGVPGESDSLNVERVTIQSKVFNDEVPTVYGAGDDVLEGGDAAEILRTKRGDDKLTGGRGRDILDAGHGDDEIYAGDGERDEVDCGSGDDFASLDEHDVAANNCEEVAVLHP